ncbi:Hydrogenase/urease accessory protein HupE [Parasphingorhabdus marina DSM 22363]|uniref:Hydrogenase/urease accessory protein HupE n=1 Tax=Parasphingorhabdus marina DSM 22363 TaxID=1123272 RepID=A0A1N6CN49_9SPHN|nr:HupE/UreJ family protein [Parasphingorhabdus marina]SIN60000.1 Hydrogenase/urease accessory protein HupE [Parasphingorhabdus marina DSM 22363]
MRWIVWLVIIVSGLNWSVMSQADELRPAYIELNQVSGDNWRLTWKASARSRLGQTGAVIIPENCRANGEPDRQFAADNILTFRDLACSGSIEGQTIGLSGLELSNTDALVRISSSDGSLQTLRLTPDAPSVVIPSADGETRIGNVAAAYTVLGIEHILEGFDHLLFVLALVLLLKGGWLVVQTVTAFTIAHSLTLVGTTLGYLSLPQQPVEIVIALSIVFLAVEIVKAQPGESRLSERFPWIVAFLFGLLHGFGFAGALAEIGLPQDDVPLALFTFNLGVEIGQLLIVAGGLLVLALIRRLSGEWLRPAKLVAAYGIGTISTYWFLERLIA